MNQLNASHPDEVFEAQVRRYMQRFWQNASTDGLRYTLLSDAILEAVRRQSRHPFKYARVLAIDTTGLRRTHRVVWEAQLK